MKRGLIAFLAVLALGSGVSASPAAADSQIIVTPSNQQGWSTADTRPGGTVTFVADTNAPGDPHRGALQLTTDATTTAKAQYLHAANTPLAGVTELGYYTKQVSALFPGGDPSYQLIVCLNGVTGTGACNPNADPLATTSSFTTLVFEPYQNGVVVNNTWQQWDVDAGQFWSTRTVLCDGGAVAGQGVTGGAGGAPFYTLDLIKTMCPNAIAVGFGVNIGSNNPGYIVRTDLVDFNGTVYNFEPDATCRDKGNNKDGNKEKDNHKDGNKLPVCKDQDSGDNNDSGNNDNSGDNENSN